MDKVFSRFNPRRTPDKNLSELVPAHSAIPSCASEISDSREGEGASKTMRSSDFSSSVSGRTEIKESNFSKLRLRPSNVRLTCVCVFVFSRFLYVIRVLVFLFLFFGKVGFESKRSVTIIRLEISMIALP